MLHESSVAHGGVYCSQTVTGRCLHTFRYKNKLTENCAIQCRSVITGTTAGMDYKPIL